MDVDVEINDNIQRYNRIKRKVGKKNIKLMRSKNLLNNDNLSDKEIQNIILSLSTSLEITSPNIFRYLSFKINVLFSERKPLVKVLKEIINSGVILIFIIQILIPICVIISEFRYLIVPTEIERYTYKISVFLLSICFMYHIHNELLNEYRESYLLLHTESTKKEIIILGMMSNFICSLLSIICIPIVINRSTNIIELVFNSTAILFLCQLDESLVSDMQRKEYSDFISRYKICQLHTYNFKESYTFNILYHINYYIFWFTNYFCRISFIGLPLLLLFFY